MKKQVLFLVLFFLCTLSFGQRITFRTTLNEVKLANRGSYQAGSEKMMLKYYPSLNNDGRIVYNVTGGKNDGSYLIMPAKPSSFAESDIPTSLIEGRPDFWRVNVLPFIESSQTDILEYQPDFSTSKLEEGENVEKYLVTEFTVINRTRAGLEVRKKMSKAWEKMGHKMIVFSTWTGVNRIYHSRLLPNGWKELDAVDNFVTVYDEVHGKGAWEKDSTIINEYWDRTDNFLLQVNKTLSSK